MSTCCKRSRRPWDRKIDIRLMPWEAAQQAVLRGEADAVTTMAITEKRKALFDFSDVTLTFQYSIFVGTEPSGIRTPKDLEGRTVAVTRGGLPFQVLGSNPNIEFVFIDDYLEGFGLLLSHAVDAVAADLWVGAYTLQENGIRGVTVLEDPFAVKEAGIAVRKGNGQLLRDINLGVRKLIADGTIQSIQRTWAPQ
jgi:ABC-type amino acid transport substrate-binding protein